MKPPLKILYEDEFILASNKLGGMASVPGVGVLEAKTVQGLMRRWAFSEKGCKPYLLNRLDQKTSGVILMGKFPRDREKLEAIFADPRTKKVYLALVKGVPKRTRGTITFPLEARTAKIKVRAVTHYRVVEKFTDCSMVEATIETGRKHQIRKHFAMIHHPLVMDSEYGESGFNRQFHKEHGRRHMFLHAWKISFFHPFLNREITIESAPSL